MSTFDPRSQLAQGGDSIRVAVQRLSDLPLMSLFEIARVLEGGADRSGDSVEGFNIATLRTTLRDVSGSLFLADICTRRNEHERPWDGQQERNGLVDGVNQALVSGKTDDARTLLAVGQERFPGDSLVAVAAGLVHWAAGELDEARQRFAAAQSPDADAGLKADALFLQAIVTGDMGEHEFAINVLERSAVTEESLDETWSRPAARARYAQARLIAVQLGQGTLAEEYADRCRKALFQAIDTNGYFFGPAYVEPCFGLLEGLRNELNDRFNALSLESNLTANAGLALVRDLRPHRFVEHERLQRAREVFEGRGFFSRSRLMAVGVRTVVKLRDEAAAAISARLDAAARARDEEHALAESTRRRGEERAHVELAHGAETTRALDMRAFTLRQTTSDRFRMEEALEPQYRQLALECLAERKRRLLRVALGATLVLALAVIFLPGPIAKIIGAAAVAGASAWLLTTEQRRYREAMAQLDEELERARGVRALEQNVSANARQAEAQSHVQSKTVRRQAEADWHQRIERADERFGDEIYDIRRRVSSLVETNARFFRTIDGAQLPEATFTPPNVEAIAPNQRQTA